MNESPGAPAPPKHSITWRQRNLAEVMVLLANDLDSNGTRAEQHTAALLRLVADAIERQSEAEAVALLRAWRLEQERMST